MASRQDRVERVRSTRRELATAGPARLRTEGDFAVVALPGADGDVLRDLLIAERATTVIEVGLAYGSSALAIAEALVTVGGDGGARHIVVDAFQHHFHGAGWQALVDAGVADICELLAERSQLALPRLVAEGLTADAAFVDGSHVFHNVFVDLVFLWDLVRPGGLVVLDDCDDASVATAVRYFERNAGWRPVPIDRPTRLRAVRLPDPRPDLDFRAFRPFGDGEG
jgi:predicted O-methyltransferase YrrM